VGDFSGVGAYGAGADQKFDLFSCTVFLMADGKFFRKRKNNEELYSS